MKIEYTKLAKRVIDKMSEIAKDRNDGIVESYHLLLALLAVEEGPAYVLCKDYGVTYDKVSQRLEYIAKQDKRQSVAQAVISGEYSPTVERILSRAAEYAAKANVKQVGTDQLLLSVLTISSCSATEVLSEILGIRKRNVIGKLLRSMNISPAAIREVLKEKEEPADGKVSAFLAKYTVDLTKKAAENRMDRIIGRDKETERILQILCRRTKNNPCLVGEPGVGKTAVVEGLAWRIVDDNVPDALKNKKILSLDLSGMVAGSKYRGEFEERIKKVIQEVKTNRDIILFLDEIHTMIGAGSAEGSLDASNILKPALSRGEIQIIGATTANEYKKYFEKDAALERRFQPVDINEPTIDEAIKILKGIKGYYEDYHKALIDDEALVQAVKLSERYISDRNLPDKAIDIIDEALARVSLTRKGTSVISQLEKELSAAKKDREEAVISGDFERAMECKNLVNKLNRKLNKAKKSEVLTEEEKPVIGIDDINFVVSMWSKVPVSRLQVSETERLMKLEEILHKRVIAQDEAVKAVSKAVRRGRTGIKDPKRPIGSFLFLGPTGVGKTELTKALGEALFGDSDSVIRVDMSEYMESHSVSKLIGSPPGYVGFEERGQLTERVRKNPYSIILFDEIEKAHPDVFNILLQILDDGHITDSTGRKIDFKNTVIIMTSNAGASAIVSPKHLGFSKETDNKADYEKMKSDVLDEIKKIFKPEFLNRIDDIIVFHSLLKENMHDIIDILIENLNKVLEESSKVKVELTSAAKDLIIDESYDSKYGARPLKRAVQSKLEDELADMFLDGRLSNGKKVVVDAKDKKLVFKIKK